MSVFNSCHLMQSVCSTEKLTDSVLTHKSGGETHHILECFIFQSDRIVLFRSLIGQKSAAKVHFVDYCQVIVFEIVYFINNKKYVKTSWVPAVQGLPGTLTKPSKITIFK